MPTLTPTRVTFERILVPTDFSDASERAVRYAKLIAKEANSQLLIVHVNPPVDPITPPEAAWIDQEAHLRQIEERLEQSGAALRSEGFRANAFSVTGPLQSEIIFVVERGNVDLIVLGTHAHRGFERLMLGSDAEAVLRHVSCPVVTVGPGAPEPTGQTWNPKNIVCATTLDPNSAKTAAYAYRIAQQFGSQIAFFHVQTAGRRDARDWEAFEYALEQEFPPNFNPNPALATLLSKDLSGTQIADFARRRSADLIIMGARTASAVASHFSRGTVGEVFAHAQCPVMTLNEP